jgi:hypothetical protein
MWRKLLVYGVLCVVVAGGAVAYLAGVQPGDFGAAAPVAGKGIEMPAKAAFLAKDLATLEAPLEAAIDADLSAMADLQGSRRWDRELEPLIPTGPGTVLWKDAFEEYVEYRRGVPQRNSRSGRCA